jgi:hypothetical protein
MENMHLKSNPFVPKKYGDVKFNEESKGYKSRGDGIPKHLGSSYFGHTKKNYQTKPVHLSRSYGIYYRKQNS